MEKTVIVINGRGGVGKDTLCDAAALRYKVMNVSSITPIKNIALANGWDGGKDAKSRKFLSDLKQLFTEYNELPTIYLYNCYEEFMAGDGELMFVHIREPKEIDKFKERIPTRCVTLLVEREQMSADWGNASDDEVNCYEYDYVYQNNRPLEAAGADFIDFLESQVCRQSG